MEQQGGQKPKLTLYHMPGAPSLRIKWLLHELGLPFEEKTLESYKDLRSPSYLAELHPLGNVPVLKDGEVVIWESAAIMEWILDAHAPKKLVPTPNTKEHATYLQFYHFAESTMFEPVMQYLKNTVYYPPSMRSSFAVQDAKNALGAQLQMLDRYFEKTENEYIVGKMFTAADIMLGYSLLMIARFMTELLPDDVFKVASYYARLTDRKAYVEATGDYPMVDPIPPIVDYTDSALEDQTRLPPTGNE